MKKVVYIENEGALFRGFARAWPQEVWNAKEKKFVPYKGHVPKEIEWGDVISEAEAQKLMKMKEVKGSDEPNPILQVAH